MMSTPSDKELLKFRLGIERSGDAVFMTEPDGAISYVNPAFEKLYGFSAAEALGKTPRILKSGALAAEQYVALWAKLLAKEVVSGELVNRAKDGRLVFVEASVNPILDDAGSIVGFLAIHHDMTHWRDVEQQLRASEEALRESEAKYRGLFDNSPIPTWLTDADTMRLLAVNDTATRVYGYTRPEMLQMTVADLHRPEDQGAVEVASRAAPTGLASLGAWKHRTKDGTLIDVEVTAQKFKLGGDWCKIVYAQDVTEKKRLEEQFRQAQKMEAVGRLAGGIAHDFNNMLSVVLSYTSLAMSGLAAADPLREDLHEIEEAGQRAADLTRQLLAFSRRQVLQPKIVDLNDSLGKMDRMLRRLLGEDIELLTVTADALWPVHVDPGQIEQLVMNLAVNARDAMPRGGRLVLETENVELDRPLVEAETATPPGRYVRLTVRDTGTGMDEATRSHIFEPFFTTKEAGKGTGLGLSTVFGIVQQSGGSIAVESHLGAGTTFKLYLPRAAESALTPSVAPVRTPLHRGTETILLAEDDDQLRQLITTILGRKGYVVLAAASPAEALVLAERHGGRPIHLLLTDVVMPGMNGRELAQKLTLAHPEACVLFMSGYTGSVVVDHGVFDHTAAFIQKPMTPDLLLRKLREVLDAPRGSASG